MKYIFVIFFLMNSSCGIMKEMQKEDARFISGCMSDGKKEYQCVFLLKAMRSSCQAEKVQSAAMVGGMVGGMISNGGK